MCSRALKQFKKCFFFETTQWKKPDRGKGVYCLWVAKIRKIWKSVAYYEGSSINDVTALGGGGNKGFVTTIIKFNYLKK